MSKRLLFIILLLAAAAIAAAMYRQRGERVAQPATSAEQLPPVAIAQTTPAAPLPAPSSPPIETPPAAIALAPILTNAMRDVVVTVEGCVLSIRTLRCSFVVTNQSPAEKKFNLGIGGTGSRFESEAGGAVVFDDIGNDFLSVGGGVANRAVPNCSNWSPCELEKTLTPNVKTSGWLRFDAVDPKANAIKLLRMKWNDGEAWVPMDFRNVPLTHEMSATASPPSS